MMFRASKTMSVHLACLALTVAMTACGSVGEESGDEAEAQDDGPALNDLPSCDGDAADGEACTDDTGARLCAVDTGYPGDELALCGPDQGDGFLFHYGPSDYDDPDEVAKYLLEGGGEDENCVYLRTPNEETVFANTFHGRMRPGSHHLIVTITEESDDIVFNTPVSCSQSGAITDRWLVGSQDPQIDVSVTGSEVSGPLPGDPEFGGAIRIPPSSILRVDMHYLNPTDNEILREAWIWLERVPEDEVEVEVDLISWLQGSIDVPPQSTGVTTSIARCNVPTDRNLALVTGHFHENGTRFTVWHEPQGQEPVKIYETFDWENPGNGVFNDRQDNPPMGDVGARWGARSGYMELKAGDHVNFQCEFDNPTDETVALGDTGKDQMCNVFGFYYPSDGDTWDCSCLGSLCLSGLNF